MVTRRQAWTVALVAAFTMMVSYVDRSTLSVLAPTVREQLGMTKTDYGFLTSAFSIAYLVAVPISGWWIDRQGARRGLLMSVLVWSSIAALHALVPGFAALFALRIALGVAEAPGFPGAAQTMYRILPEGDRSRGYSLLFTGSSIGSMIAPLLASWLFTISSWRVAFLATAIVGLSWLPLWLWATRDREVRARLDTREVGGPAALPWHVIARHPIMIRALIGVCAAAPVVGFGLAWSAEYLAKAFAVAQGDQGHYLWLPPLGLDLGAIAFGDLAARLKRAPGSPPRALWVAAMALASSLALLPMTDGPWSAAAVMAVSLAGGGGMYTLVTADLLARTPAGSVSLTGGIVTAAQSIALIVAGPLIGSSADATGNYAESALWCGLWIVPGALVWLLWPPAGSFVADGVTLPTATARS